MRTRGSILALLVAFPLLAEAADVPVQGKRLQLHASQRSAAKRGARIVLRDAALAAPFADAGAHVGPGAMRDTLRLIQDEVEQLGTPVSPRCDDEGRPGP